MDSLPSSLNSSKRLKEEFVSNLTGSSILEVAAVLTNVSILILLRHSVSSDRLIKDVSLKKSDDENLSSKDWRAYITTLAADFLVIVLPTILFLTVLSDWTYIWTISLMTLLFFICAAKGSCSHSPPFEPGVHSLKSVLSSYRFSVMIGTCLCIMAVDFRIFPRKYAKTETYGTSLMDLGVGSFVLVNSLVSRQARSVSSMSWKTAFQSTSPLIILGLVRLVSTASVDYQVHVSEYGVHWNFFFTLAAVSILTSIINVPPSYSGILGSLVLVGYWGMYLLGVQLGNYLFFGNHSSAMLRSNSWARVWIPMLLFWTTVLLDRYVEGVSRRMCNLPYVTMVLALNLQVLSVLTLSDYIPGSKTSILEQAFNRNLLGSFLLANVLTGLVNLSVDTLSASSVAALFILVLYASVLTIVVGIADFCCIRLKFW
ncbi:uncharacterized protein At4g17910 isoform X3 [Carya illinoinensis]|uniref:GPI-anchored wall transfer protein n=1 Tax=Carya illinoinensis TaxID=32201 RepID=A0A8T1NU53_CARIL|nr:uncharacterized protein At4g17910 isoform X3 [Carya illinoinensis]KAG6633668.1 hypothetical protein CIPAW_12G064900 [Carya illinoinensis]KAG6684430.1 hypothetical protein I3842_12G063200 [Carya illinoinensis]